MHDAPSTHHPRHLSPRAATVAAAAVLAALATGCPHNRYRGLAASAVAPSVEPVTTTVPDVEMTYIHDANGVAIASEARVIGHHEVVTDYTLMRGDQAIDEQDYYHLADDHEAFGKIRAARARGARTMKIGIGIMALAAVGTVVSPIVLDGLGGQVASGASLVFGLPIGLFVWWHGKQPFRDHVMSVGRAFSAVGQEPPSWAQGLR